MTLKDLQKIIVKFRDKRDWRQFHNPKDMAISLSLEASELLEHFQWKSETETKRYLKNHRKELGEELSDVLYWILLLSHDLEINLEESFKKKMKTNESKYPIKKSKGKNTKYTDF